VPWLSADARMGALYAATKHAVEGYSESLEPRAPYEGAVRVSVIEPAVHERRHSTRTSWNRTPSSMSYREARAGMKQEGERSDGNRRTACVVCRHRAEGGQRGAPEDPIRGRSPLRTACDYSADLRLLAWWTPGFERTCGLMFSAA